MISFKLPAIYSLNNTHKKGGVKFYLLKLVSIMTLHLMAKEDFVG